MLKLPIFGEMEAKIEISPKKFLISGLQRIFLLEKNKLTSSICTVIIKTVLIKYFSKQWFLMLPGSTNSSPSNLDGLPYSRVRWYPNCFHQNDHKGCKIDYLDAPRPFPLAFWNDRVKWYKSDNYFWNYKCIAFQIDKSI